MKQAETAPPQADFLSAIKIARTDSGDYRVNFRPDTIRAGFLAVGLPLPSSPIVHSRCEATAYYTDDAEDAADTGRAMLTDALRNPAQLVHERDLPPGFACTAAHRARFQELLNA